MPDTQNQVLFTYHGCDKATLEAHEASFREDDFRNELGKAFETKIAVERVDVELVCEEGQATGRYTARITVISPDLNPNSFAESDNSPAAPLRKAIHDAIAAIHKAKDKLEADLHHKAN